MEYEKIKEYSRWLRNNPTRSERKLWCILRKRKLMGYRFRRQHPIVYGRNNDEYFFFITDFYCHELTMIIELDGKIHDFQREKDQRRDDILKSMGFSILHIKNEELKDIRNVRRSICRYIMELK